MLLRRWPWTLALGAALFAAAFLWDRAPSRPSSTWAAEVQTRGDLEFCLLFGVNQNEPAAWDGSISASGARIVDVRGWRPGGGDRISGSEWKLSTQRVSLTRGAPKAGPRVPTIENGVYVRAEVADAAARFDVKTAQGGFSFDVNELVYGEPLERLDGLVTVERLPLSTRLTRSAEEQDYPALAVAGGRAYLAYVEFTHGDRSQKWPRQLIEKPESFEPLRRPAGGDQVFLMEYDSESRAWSAPQPVSRPGQDVYRAAVALDGRQRVWVVWSAQVSGNFDLFARHREAGRWSQPVRVTVHPGADLNPVAVADSSGTIWLAWQGFRDGNFEILAARQQGALFSVENTVSFSAANDWAPQLAAGPNGAVAAVWDTYHKGDYDVYARRLSYDGSIQMQAPQPVAAGTNFEARASAAYDSSGRLWVAYEESFPAWGKDFGAYETTGAGLYQGNTVRVKILEGGKYWTTASALDDVLIRHAASNPQNRGPSRRTLDPRPLPDPKLAGERPPNVTPYPRITDPPEGYPRLAAAGDGSVYLAYRTAAGRIWGPLGTTWFENLAWFDGERWRGPVYVGNSDAILDVRPALGLLPDRRLLMVAPTDFRFVMADRRDSGRSGDDPFHYDLFAHEFQPPAAASAPRLSAIPAERPAPPPSSVAGELRQVERMRDYRVRIGGDTLRLMRGEFHRHTSISGDGGRDGGLIDAWRYLLDAAYMDWAGCCDHDNGGGREYTWWQAQKMTDAFHASGRFVPVFSYERSVRYPEGHRNVIFAQRGVRPLPRLPKTEDDSPPEPAPDTQMLYEYLREFGGVAAVHTSSTNMGTDWRDNDPLVEPVVEIYQGDRQNYEMPGAPRSNAAEDSIGGWRPLGFVSNALDKGYRLAFQASSDHISTHMSYCNVWVTEPTREGIVEAFRRRRLYGATDNILADVRCGRHFMGEEFAVDEPPEIDVKLFGTAEFAQVHIIKDGRYVYSLEPGRREVEFSWRDTAAERGKTSYYYVRGEQADGEIVWVSPMWIELR